MTTGSTTRGRSFGSVSRITSAGGGMVPYGDLHPPSKFRRWVPPQEDGSEVRSSYGRLLASPDTQSSNHHEVSSSLFEDYRFPTRVDL